MGITAYNRGSRVNLPGLQVDLTTEVRGNVVSYDGSAWTNTTKAYYETRDYDTWAAAIASIGATKATLVVSENIAVAANVSVPSNVILEYSNGAELQIATGVTLTINSDATNYPLRKVFDCAGTGKVVFGKPTGVSPEWFGAVGDGATEDQVAVQKTVDVCLAGSRPHPFLVNGRYLLAEPINIDRPIYDPWPTEGAVDHGVFRFIATGSAAGFYTSSEITLFTTTLDNSTQAVFESSDASDNSYVLDGSFIRIRFSECTFVRIKGVYAPSPSVVFSISFDHCMMWGWQGIFYNVPTVSTDISFLGNKFESGGTGVQLGYAVGCRICHNLFESATGPFLVFQGTRGTEISGNYIEAVCSATGNYVIDLVSTGGFTSGGTVVSANYFSLGLHILDPTFYAIYADGSGLSLIGNFSYGASLIKYLTVAGNENEPFLAGNYSQEYAYPSSATPLSSPIYGNGLRIMANNGESTGGAMNRLAYGITVATSTKTRWSTLFNAASTSDSAVVWQQPANSLLVGAEVRLDEKFVASGLTSLLIDVGDADANGLIVGARNWASDDPWGTADSVRGALWSGGAVGTELYASTAKDWTATVTAVGANLNTLSAGQVTFYFVYRQL
jgi:hypothetical protein